MSKKELPFFYKQKEEESARPWLKLIVFLGGFLVLLLFYQSFFQQLAYEEFSREELFANSQQKSAVEQKQALNEWFRVLQKSEENKDWDRLKNYRPQKVESRFLMSALSRELHRKKIDDQYVAPLLGVLGFSKETNVAEQIAALSEDPEFGQNFSSEFLVLYAISLGRLVKSEPLLMAVLERVSAIPKDTFHNAWIASLRHLMMSFSKSGDSLSSQAREKVEKYFLDELEKFRNSDIRWSALLALAELGNPIVNGPFEEIFREIDEIKESFSAFEQNRLVLYEEVLRVSWLFGNDNWSEKIRVWAQSHPHVKLRLLAKNTIEKESP